MNREYRDLIEIYLEDSSSEKQIEQILELVRNDEEFRLELAEASRIQGLIKVTADDSFDNLCDRLQKSITEMEPDNFELEVMQGIEKKFQPASVKRWQIAFWTAVAAQIFFVLYFSTLSPDNVPVDSTLASLYSESGKAILIRGGREIDVTPDLRLMDGDEIIVEQKGDVRITWNDSTVTQFKDSSAAVFSLRDGAPYIFMRRGKLFAKVNPRDAEKPFRIETLNSKVKVLGTKFIMKVNQLESMLEVKRGAVEFSKNSDETRKVVVREHEFAIVSPGRDLQVFEDNTPVYRSREVNLETKDRKVDIVAEINGSRNLYLVVHNGRDGIAFDHAGWLKPRLENAAGKELSLLELTWKYAGSEWGVTGRAIDAKGEKLTHKGRYCPDGIGTHALSIIEYEIPEGYKIFKATGVITDSGSSQINSLSSIVFEVHTEYPEQHYQRLMLREKGR